MRLFDGPKSVLSDINNIVKQSQEAKVNKFVDEAISKGYKTPQDVGNYAHKKTVDRNFAAAAQRVAEDKLK